MTRSEQLWWAVAGGPDNHNYVIRDGVQHCHLCDEIESPLRHPTGDKRVNRAAMHLVHGVKEHLNVTASEWNASHEQEPEGRARPRPRPLVPEEGPGEEARQHRRQEQEEGQVTMSDTDDLPAKTRPPQRPGKPPS